MSFSKAPMSFGAPKAPVSFGAPKAASPDATAAGGAVKAPMSFGAPKAPVSFGAPKASASPAAADSAAPTVGAAKAPALPFGTGAKSTAAPLASFGPKSTTATPAAATEGSKSISTLGAPAPGAPAKFGAPAAAATSTPAAPVPIVPKYPVTHASISAALNDGWIDDALASLVKTYLTAPLKKPTVSAVPGAAAAQPAFEASALDRNMHDMACLFALFSASVDAVEGLAALLASISQGVVTNLAQFIAFVPPPTNHSRFMRSPAEERQQQQQHQLLLSAAELLVLVLNEWQIGEPALKELLAAVTQRVMDLAQHGVRSTAHATSQSTSALAVTNASVIAYLSCTALIAALNVWGTLRRTNLNAGPNELCVRNGSTTRSLVEWLDRLQKDLKPQTNDAPVASLGVTTNNSTNNATPKLQPIAGRFASICALAVGCFVFQAEDDVGLDIALAAIQSHARAPRQSSSLRRVANARVADRNAEAPHHHHHHAFGGVDAIGGYGKALKNIATFLPPAETLTIPRAVAALVVFRMVKHVVCRMGPLLHHLSELDVSSYRALGNYASFTAKNASRGSNQPSGDYYSPVSTYQQQNNSQVQLPAVPKFHIPQLLRCISVLLDELPEKAIYDELSPFLDPEDVDDFDEAAPPSSIAHLLTHNLPLHFRQLFDVRRGVTLGATTTSTTTLDAPCYKQLGAHLACLARIARIDANAAQNVTTALSEQVECSELRFDNVVNMMRECVGLAPLRTAGHHPMSNQASAHSDKERHAILAALFSSTSIRQLSLNYLDKQRGAVVSGATRLFTSLAQYQVTPIAVEHLFQVLTSPELQQDAAGDVFALIAALTSTPEAVALTVRYLDEHGLLNFPALRQPTEDNKAILPPHQARVVSMTEPSTNGADLAAALANEARAATYPLTIGFLRLVCAIVAFPLPPEALPLVDFVAQQVLSGFTRRSYAVEKEKYIVGALACSAMRRLLSPAAWTNGVVPYASIMAPAQAPSDVLGDCIAVITSAAADVHHKQNSITPMRFICIREVIGLVTAALETPPAMPWISALSQSVGSTTAVERTAPGRKSVGAVFNQNSFAILARTRESSEFVAALVRLCLLDDAVSAAMALELAAAIAPPSTAPVVRDIEHADPSALSQVLQAMTRILAPIPEHESPLAPIALTYDVRGVPGFIGPESLGTDEEHTGNKAAAIDRLRHAAIDLIIRCAASKTPALALWLCGYASGHAAATAARNALAQLPSWARSAAGLDNQVVPLASDCVLDPILASLNDAVYSESHVLLAAKFTKLLVTLLTNTSTNTPELRAFLRVRDGFDFLGSAFATLGMPAEVAASVNDGAENLGDPSGPAVVYKAAFSLKLLTNQFFVAAQHGLNTITALQSSTVADAEVAGESEFITRNLTWLLSVPFSSNLPPVIADALGDNQVSTVLGRWLVAGLLTAPANPQLPVLMTPDGVDVAALCLVMPKSITADIMGPTPAETQVPQYDVAAMYRVHRTTDPRSNEYSQEQWRELLAPYIDANEGFKAHMMVGSFVDAWSEFTELLCGCYWESIPASAFVSVARLTFAVATGVVDSAVFNNSIEVRVVDALYRAIVALLGAILRLVNQSRQNPDHAASVADEVNVNVVADLVTRAVNGFLRFSGGNATPTLRVNTCASLLCILRFAKAANVPVDETDLLVSAEPLFLRLTADATTGHPTSRIMALRTLYSIMDGREAVVAAMITPRRSGSGGTYLRHFVLTVITSMNEAVAASLSQAAALNDAMHAAEWIEALFAVFVTISEEAPNSLESADLLRQIAECEAWDALSAVLLAHTQNNSVNTSAGHRNSASLLRSTAVSTGPTPAHVTLAARAFAAVTTLVASLVDKLHAHQTAPQDAAAFIQANLVVLGQLISPTFVEVASHAALRSDSLQLARILASSAHLLLALSTTDLVHSMAPLSAKLHLPQFFASLVDSIGVLSGTEAPGRAPIPQDHHRDPDADFSRVQTPAVPATGALHNASANQKEAIKLLSAALTCTSICLLNIAIPPGDQAHGVPVNDLAPHGNGRELLIGTLSTHSRVAAHLSAHVTADEHCILEAVTNSAQAVALIINLDVTRTRRARNSADDLSPTEKATIRDATRSLVHSTAIAAKRIAFGDSPDRSAAASQSNGTAAFSLYGELPVEDSAVMGHNDEGTTAHAAAASARATQVILGSLLKSTDAEEHRRSLRASRQVTELLVRPNPVTVGGPGDTTDR